MTTETETISTPVPEIAPTGSEATSHSVEAMVKDPNCSTHVEIEFSETDLVMDNEHNDGAISFPCSPLGLPDDNDDQSSASEASLAYFEPADFRPSNWMQSVDVPTLGLAVIALTVALVHPILFVAGALTIFGTATAVGASSGVLAEADFCNKNTTVEDADAIGAQHAAAEEVPESTDDSTNSSSQSPEPAAPEPIHSVSLKTDDSLSRKQTAGSLAAQRSWVEASFPTLEHRVIQDEAFVGLSTVQFFNVFLADDAPYNFVAFQQKRGDTNIRYGKWEPEATDGALSLIADENPSSSQPQLFPKDFKHLSFLKRTLTFKAKTNSFMGPKYASTTRTQRMLIVSKKIAILESKTTLADIPFCNTFFVAERWIITAKKESGRYTSLLSSFCEVKFSSKCPFESQIRSKSKSTVADVGMSWCKMAQQALQLTEEAKKERLLRKDDIDNDDDDDASEGEAAPKRSDPGEPRTSIEVEWDPNMLPPMRKSMTPPSKQPTSKLPRRRTLSLGSFKRKAEF